MSSNHQLPHLPYAVDRPPIYRRKRWRRGALVVVAVVIGYATYQTGTIAWRQFEVLRLQRECLAYTAPSDQVVFENDKERARSLEGRPGYATEGLFLLPLKHTPAAWERLAELERLYVTDQATVFLHERIAPAGQRRLVAVQMRGPASEEPFRIFVLESRRLKGPLLVREERLPRETAPRVASKDYLTFGSNPLRVFAGRPDPADASHFTIDFEADGQRHTLDGWLADDDTVTLMFRAGS